MTTTVRPGSEIARPAPPTNQTHTTSSLSTVTFTQHQPPISTQDEHSNSVAAAGRADRAQPHPRPRRSIPCERADEPPGDHRRQRALRCFAHPRYGAHRERDRVQPAWSIAVRAVTPSREAQLAPHRGADPGSRGRARGAHRSLDELFLSSPAWRWRVAGNRTARRRAGNAGEHLAGCCCHTATRLQQPRRVEDARLRNRSRRRHAGVHDAAVVVVFGPIGAADELPRTVLMTAGWV